MFSERRQKVLDAMGPDAVAIFQGARLATRSRDTEFRFRQDSDFWYLTGFGHPDAVAVLRTDGGPAYTLYVQPRDPEMEIWNGYRPGVEGASSDFGADEARENSSFRADLPGLIQKAKRLYHVLGVDPAVDEIFVSALENLRLRSRQGLEPANAIEDPRAIVHEMRLFKEPAELDVMRRASEISREAHAEAAKIAHDGRHEYELEAAIEYTFRRRGGSGPAYASIVGGGANATVLHYIANDQKLSAGDVVLIDAGTELEGYASDVTRTYPVGGRYEGAARDVYDVVLEAQLAGVAAGHPGATLGAIHELTVRRLTEGMIQLGLLQGSVDMAIAEEAYRRFYMHNTSHWLGLDVHDVGRYRIDGEHRPLEAGMVYTIEPGIYVSRDDKDVPDAFRGIGIRIEDDIAITDGGHENLTDAIPKAPEDVEALVASS